MPTINPWFLNEAAPALCRTLLHSLWQGLVISILAGLVLLTTKKTAAAARYKCFLLLLCGAVMWVAVTFVQELGSGGSSSPASQSTVVAKESELFPNIILPQTAGEDHSSLDNLLSTVNHYSLPIVGAWFFFFLLHLLRLATGLRSIQQMKRQQVHTPSPIWKAWINEQCRTLGISQRVLLLESEIIRIPAVIGIAKPVILVPMGLLTGLTASQVE